MTEERCVCGHNHDNHIMGPCARTGCDCTRWSPASVAAPSAGVIQAQHAHLEEQVRTLTGELEAANHELDRMDDTINRNCELAEQVRQLTAERDSIRDIVRNQAVAEIRRLTAERDRLLIDSGNYRGKCAVCSTPCCDMLTDCTCIACERDHLRSALESLLDWQNGPPLSSQKWMDGWTGAIKEARDALPTKAGGPDGPPAGSA